MALPYGSTTGSLHRRVLQSIVKLAFAKGASLQDTGPALPPRAVEGRSARLHIMRGRGRRCAFKVVESVPRSPYNTPAEKQVAGERLASIRRKGASLDRITPA